MLRVLSILIVPKQLNKSDSDTDSESGNSTNSEDGNDPNDKSLCDAWKFCQKWSKSVEVLYKNMNGHQILTKVHFHYNPEVHNYNYLYYELEVYNIILLYILSI